MPTTRARRRPSRSYYQEPSRAELQQLAREHARHDHRTWGQRSPVWGCIAYDRAYAEEWEHLTGENPLT